MDHTKTKVRIRKKNLLVLIIIFFVAGSLFLSYQFIRQKSYRQVLTINPAKNLTDGGAKKSADLAVEIPEELKSSTRKNIQINEWSYTEKESGLQVNVVALPFGIDYAKKAYIGIDFDEFSNGTLKGWHIRQQDRFDVYILQKDVTTFVWITADLASVMDKQKARARVRYIADSIRITK